MKLIYRLLGKKNIPARISAAGIFFCQKRALLLLKHVFVNSADVYLRRIHNRDRHIVSPYGKTSPIFFIVPPLSHAMSLSHEH